MGTQVSRKLPISMYRDFFTSLHLFFIIIIITKTTSDLRTTFCSGKSSGGLSEHTVAALIGLCV